MRVIIIDPERQRVEERHINGGAGDFRRILAGQPIFGTFFAGDAAYVNA